MGIRISILLMTFLFSGATLAQEKVIVQSVDPDVELTSLDKNIYETRIGIKDAPVESGTLLSPKLIDEKISAAGLEKETQAMDQMDKDFFFLKAKEYSEQKFLNSYPEVSKDKLLGFRKLVNEGTKK